MNEDRMTNKNKTIREAIMEVIVFFDIFSFPLSLMEIWRFLPLKAKIGDIQTELQKLDILDSKNGLYFLKGRGVIIHKRNRRYNYHDRKMKRAMRISRVFKLIPWINMIAIGNIMGSGNHKDGSDIDFFIITEKNRVWMTRFITTVLTKLLMLRPKVNDVRDKICLSFYISTEAMNLKPLHLPDKKDIYFIYWLANLQPIYDKESYYSTLIEKNNYLKVSLPNWEEIKRTDNRNIGQGFGFNFNMIIDLFFGGLEKQVKILQLKILPKDLRDIMNKDTRVVISDSVLKLHVKDRRQTYLKQFTTQIKNHK